MSRELRTEVLVVGAGPVGLWAAWILAERGIQVTLIGEEHTGDLPLAVILHPATLRLLSQNGLDRELWAAGQRVERIELYDADGLMAAADMAAMRGEYPHALTLSLPKLVAPILKRLRERHVDVRWSHRLAELTVHAAGVTAEVEKLDTVSAGYIVPHQGTVVKKRFPIEAAFVIGADGAHSLVRDRLRLAAMAPARTERFAVFEGEGTPGARRTLQVGFDGGLTCVRWPLPEERWRWLFELGSANGTLAPHYRDDLLPPLGGWATRRLDGAALDALLDSHAPWFSARGFHPAIAVELVGERRQASRFGRDRVWLAGDAAHFTWPLASESLNLGLVEATRLAAGMARVLRDGGGDEIFAAYDEACARDWTELYTLDAPTRTASALAPVTLTRAAHLRGFAQNLRAPVVTPAQRA